MCQDLLLAILKCESENAISSHVFLGCENRRTNRSNECTINKIRTNNEVVRNSYQLRISVYMSVEDGFNKERQRQMCTMPRCAHYKGEKLSVLFVELLQSSK